MTVAIGVPQGERAAAVERRATRMPQLVREDSAHYCADGRNCSVPGNTVYATGSGVGRLLLRSAADPGPTRRMRVAERSVPKRTDFVVAADGSSTNSARGNARKSPRGIPEKTLQDAWRRSAGRDISLKASDGRWYRVVYAGRRGGSYGPDFVDAVLMRDDGARITGDVEIHVRRNGWRAHGHDKDPRYNGVTFHAFLENAGETATVSSDSREVRELRLGPLLGGNPLRQGCSKPTPSPDLPVVEPLPLPLDLTTAGEERFAARVSGAELSMSHEGVDQTLYAAVMECMGFPRNKRQFRELARRLPWDTLTSWSPAGDFSRIEDLLLWAGGFADKPAGAGRLNGTAPTWTRPAGRPDNAPERRIRGAARLAARWCEGGGPARAVTAVVVGSKTPREVIRAFEAPGEGGRRSLIGSGRAAEIAVNAVLPGLCAMARLRGDRALESVAVDLYRRFPALPENSITREAKLIFALGPDKLESVYGAREQQGLIYLYRSMTTPKDMTRQLPLGAARLQPNR